MNNQQLQGCKNLTAQTLKLLDDFTKNIITRNSTVNCAETIKHDLEILIKFVGEEAPEWINSLLDLCSKHVGNPANCRFEIIKMRGDIEHYSWDDFCTISDDIDLLNYDKTFIEEAAANGLHDAIDRLVNCLRIIRDEPFFKLNKQTKIDIETLINGLNNSKGTSESSIKIWADSGWAFIKTCIPHADKVTPLNDFINKTPDAYDELCTKIQDVRNIVVERLKNEFCQQDRLILPCPEEPKKIEQQREEK